MHFNFFVYSQTEIKNTDPNDQKKEIKTKMFSYFFCPHIE